MGLRSELCAGQSSHFTPSCENNFLMNPDIRPRIDKLFRVSIYFWRYSVKIIFVPKLRNNITAMSLTLTVTESVGFVFNSWFYLP